jgi:hypothetical protein
MRRAAAAEATSTAATKRGLSDSLHVSASALSALPLLPQPEMRRWVQPAHLQPLNTAHEPSAVAMIISRGMVGQAGSDASSVSPYLTEAPVRFALADVPHQPAN